MPSSTDALLEGSWMAQASDDSVAGQILLNPAAAAGDQANYIGASAGEGAIEGYAASGSWIGAVAGAVIGLLEGIFNWNDAEDEDKSKAKKARLAYEKKLTEWHFKRDKRLNNKKAKYLAWKQQRDVTTMEKKTAEKEQSAKDKNKATAQKQNQMIDIFVNVDKMNQAERNRRINRWN